MNRIAAIMVNWNGGSLAVHSAQSIAQQSHPTDLWIFVALLGSRQSEKTAWLLCLQGCVIVLLHEFVRCVSQRVTRTRRQIHSQTMISLGSALRIPLPSIPSA